ncbi:hypothetical protein CP533_3533 [Ophiocordyceps camponoti-saundersi (nom. inval.)]|nr:hypothetical protein CP533_3533 [Ophiocordyceps camponoti-saundersi (nom. inval.)]
MGFDYWLVGIWSYPEDAVVGLTLFSVPIEEIFFFVVQTYNTGILYVMLTKQLVLPVYLGKDQSRLVRMGGIMVLCALFLVAVVGISYGGRFTYMSLILAWVTPFLTLQWAICSQFFMALPCLRLLVAVGIPSSYLCLVDSLALRRGTWVIEEGTQFGYKVLGILEVEEAVFFFATNLMIVFGLATIDYYIALEEYQMASSRGPGRQFPSLGRLLLRYGERPELDLGFIEGLAGAVESVSCKSQSMYMGSAMFQAALRIDLIMLYNFCRLLDDTVDEALDAVDARRTINICRQTLRNRFNGLDRAADDEQKDGVSLALRSAMALLPISRLSMEPLDSLLLGFETDLDFSETRIDGAWPMVTEKDLETYASRVAGTVATSLLTLSLQHHSVNGGGHDSKRLERIMTAGAEMGKALQYINMARDVQDDASIGRVYIPSTWLREEGLQPMDVVARPDDARVTKLKYRLLERAGDMYRASEAVMEELPDEVRGPVRTVVESYMAIGEMVRERDSSGSCRREGKLKLPWWRRLVVARRAMRKG